MPQDLTICLPASRRRRQRDDVPRLVCTRRRHNRRQGGWQLLPGNRPPATACGALADSTAGAAQTLRAAMLSVKSYYLESMFVGHSELAGLAGFEAG